MKKNKRNRKKRSTFPQGASITRFRRNSDEYVKLTYLGGRKSVGVAFMLGPNLARMVPISVKNKTSAADVIRGMDRIKKHYAKTFGYKTMRTLMAMKASVRFLEIALYPMHRARKTAPSKQAQSGECPTDGPLPCPGC